MTKKEIKNTLALIDSKYAFGEWLFISDKINAIALITSTNIYTVNDKYRTEYLFDDTHELLFERTVNNKNESEVYMTYAFPFSSIDAITTVSKTSPQNVYRLSR